MNAAPTFRHAVSAANAGASCPLPATTPQQGQCFHCGEPLPAGVDIRAQVDAREYAVCCEGCRAVAELIGGIGLEDYYRYRSEPAERPQSSDEQWQLYGGAELLRRYTRVENDKQRSAVVLLDGMRCAACAWLIDRMLRQQPGVDDVSVNAATARARIVWSDSATDFPKILCSIAALGYRPVPLSATALQQAAQREKRTALKRLAVAGLGMMQVMMFALPLYTGAASGLDAQMEHYFRAISLLVTTPVMLFAGWPFFASAWNALRLRGVNMDVPVAIALVLAYSASIVNTLRGRGEVYFDSVTMFIFFLTLGRFIEMLVRHRTGGVTEALARLLPRVAHRLNGTAIEDVPLDCLAVGDEVLVRVGETLPADGKIVSGETACEAALLTGEAAPLRRSVGDQVMAGTLNLEAPIQVRVTAIGQETVLSGIVALLERAQAAKPRAARAADRAAAWFLRRILGGTALIGLMWLWFDPSRAFDAVLAVLVVTCPCALSLATPAAIAAATASLARRGLLIANADALENLARIDRVLFDKTGTLTQGDVAVRHCQLLGDADTARCYALAAALEQAAEHPIARAFAAQGGTLLRAEDVRIVVGHGVEGVVAGERYRIGTPAFVGELSGGNGITANGDIALGARSGLLATFKLGDTLRADAATAIAELAELGIASEIVSGDSHAAVQRIAQATGIGTYAARLTPKDKLEHLHALQSDDPRAAARIAVIGDGINDAPILRAAPVSIALGSGSALAQASADVVLMSKSLRVLPEAVRVARRTHRIMRQNLTWATLYNLSAVPLAAFGMIPPWLAALGMSFSSVVVVLNAVRLMPRRERRVDAAPFPTAGVAQAQP